MKMLNLLIILFVSLSCGNTKISDKQHSCLSVEYIFDNTEKYIDKFNKIYLIDTTYHLNEEWVCKFDKNCFTTLSLYANGLYEDKSPCEWDEEFFTGLYSYCQDTLFCIQVHNDKYDDGSTYSYRNAIDAVYKYVVKNDLLFLYSRTSTYIGTDNKRKYSVFKPSEDKDNPLNTIGFMRSK